VVRDAISVRAPELDIVQTDVERSPEVIRREGDGIGRSRSDHVVSPPAAAGRQQPCLDPAGDPIGPVGRKGLELDRSVVRRGQQRQRRQSL